MISMRVLVTGASGFVGAAATRAFEAAGAHVVAVDVRSAPGVTELDLADPAHVEQVFSAEPFDVVAHFAAAGVGASGLLASARTDPERAVEVNIGGTVRLLQAARQAGVPKFLYASSTTVYGPAQRYGTEPVGEDAPLIPISVYGATKASAEHLGRCLTENGDTEFVAVRLPLVYGPDRWYGGALAPVYEMLGALSERRSATVTLPDAPTDWVHVDDAAQAFLALAGMATPADAYHLVGHTGSMFDLGQVLLRLSGDSSVSLQAANTDGAPLLPLISDARARADFGFAPAFPDVHAAAQALLPAGEPQPH